MIALPYLISSLLWAQDPPTKPTVSPTPVLQDLWNKKDVWLLKRVHPVGSVVGSQLITVASVSVTHDVINAEGIALILGENEEYLFSFEQVTKYIEQFALLSSKMVSPISAEETFSFTTENGIQVAFSPQGITPVITLNGIGLTPRQFADLTQLLQKALKTKKSP